MHTFVIPCFAWQPTIQQTVGILWHLSACSMQKSCVFVLCLPLYPCCLAHVPGQILCINCSFSFLLRPALFRVTCTNGTSQEKHCQSAVYNHTWRHNFYWI